MAYIPPYVFLPKKAWVWAWIMLPHSSTIKELDWVHAVYALYANNLRGFSFLHNHDNFLIQSCRTIHRLQEEEMSLFVEWMTVPISNDMVKTLADWDLSKMEGLWKFRANNLQSAKNELGSFPTNVQNSHANVDTMNLKDFNISAQYYKKVFFPSRNHHLVS